MINTVCRLSRYIMSLSPEALWSAASRERCISNINELPIFVTEKNPHRTASVLVPMCLHNGEVCLLYTLRSSNLNSHSGQVSFPGGKTDENETVYDTALRETEEEIGIPANNIDIWTKMTPVQGRDQKMVITPVVGLIKDFDMDKLQPSVDEVADIFTVPIKVLCDSNNHACFIFNDITIPVYDGTKHRIWGITALITHLFMQSLLPEKVYDFDFLRKEYKLEELMKPSKL